MSLFLIWWAGSRLTAINRPKKCWNVRDIKMFKTYHTSNFSRFRSLDCTPPMSPSIGIPHPTLSWYQAAESLLGRPPKSVAATAVHTLAVWHDLATLFWWEERRTEVIHNPTSPWDCDSREACVSFYTRCLVSSGYPLKETSTETLQKQALHER